MKLTKTLIMAISCLALLLGNAHAGERHVGSFLMGSGTGAIIGKAIGQSAESAIAGATVGGIVGLIVGNELERHHRIVSHRSHVDNRYQGHRYSRPSIREPYPHNRRPVFGQKHSENPRGHYYNPPHLRPHRDNCTKTVTIKESRHGRKRVVSTYCSNGSGQHYRDHGPRRPIHRHYK